MGTGIEAVIPECGCIWEFAYVAVRAGGAAENRISVDKGLEFRERLPDRIGLRFKCVGVRACLLAALFGRRMFRVLTSALGRSIEVEHLLARSGHRESVVAESVRRQPLVVFARGSWCRSAGRKVSSVGALGLFDGFLYFGGFGSRRRKVGDGLIRRALQRLGFELIACL